jgi:hypothetical protein
MAKKVDESVVELQDNIKNDGYPNEKPSSQGDLEGHENLDRQLDRKFDLHIIPWLFGIW